MTQDYISQVQAAIDALEESINSSMGSQRGIPQEAGYVAERWHAGTFNIDSALNESDLVANVPGSNSLGSPDVIVLDGQGNVVSLASLKYYSEASDSAREQAITVIERYRSYISSTEAGNQLSFQQYCEQNDYSSDIDELYSLYNGQFRIIPEDQIDNAISYLQGRSEVPNDNYAETLRNLKDRLESGGVSSTPCTYEEMQAITEVARTGEFTPEDFGIQMSQLITPKHVVKKAVDGGLSAAAIETVLAIGPDLFSIIREGVRTGKLDANQLRDLGIDGLIASSVGFVEGASASLILSACQSGKLGPDLVGADANVIGAIVVLVKQAIRYGYALSQGEITALQYGDLMAENIVTIACSVGLGMALQSVFPAFPFAYAIGSLVGGMLGAVGYRIIQDAISRVILHFRGAGGFEAAIPVNEESTLIEDTCSIPEQAFYEADVTYNLSSAQDLSVNLDWKGDITLGLNAEFYCTACGAVLNDMEGFDPDDPLFECAECGMLLYGENVYEGERYPGIIWFCDNCNACLSIQEGFSDLCNEWPCSVCDYVNSISTENIITEYSFNSQSVYFEEIDRACYWDPENEWYYDPDSDCYFWYVSDGSENGVWQYWYSDISSDFGEYGVMEYDYEEQQWYIERNENSWIVLSPRYDSYDLWHMAG